MAVDVIIVSVLSLLGILLILIEIFLLPGVTFAIVAGLIFSIGGIVYAYSQIGFAGGNIILGCNLVIFSTTFFWLLKSKALDKIALKTDIESTVAGTDIIDIKEGDSGISISRLNPIGKVRVNNITMEAKTLGDFIDENVEIVVLKVTRTQLIVKIK